MKLKFFLAVVLNISSVSSFSFAQTTPPMDPSRVPTTPASDVRGAITSDKKMIPVAAPLAPDIPNPRESPHSLWGVYGGLGVPHGLNVGLEYIHHSRYWSAGVDSGSLNVMLKDKADDKEELSSSSFSFEGRYHPWQAALYIGAGLGSQRVLAKKTTNYSGSVVTPKVNINNTYITPKVGWLWQFNWGLNFGFELGAQVPLSTSVDIEDGTTNPIIINNPQFIRNKKDVQDTAEKIGALVFPHFIVRFGYAF